MYQHLELDSRAIRAVERFRLPEKLGYGKTVLPVLVCSDYEKGEWGRLRLLPYGPFQMDPAAKVFLYSQEIFEGMKAVRSKYSADPQVAVVQQVVTVMANRSQPWFRPMFPRFASEHWT